MPPDTAPDIRPAIRLGTEHLRAGRGAEADAVFRRLLREEPDNAAVVHLSGMAAHRAGRGGEAVSLLRRAVALRPAVADFHNNLGTVLAQLGREPEAVGCFREAVRLKPGYAEAHVNLCTALLRCGRSAEAETAGRRAVALRPDLPGAHAALAGALRASGKVAESIEQRKQATALGLDYPEAYNELAVALEEQGRLAEALAAYRRAVALAPADPAFHSNLLFALHYDPTVGAEALAAEHHAWARRHADPLAGERRPHGNDRDPGRRLRLGYVSADFREHTRALFMEGVLASHDRGGFEVYVYSDVSRPDATTDRIRGSVQVWRETAGLSHAALAEAVRADAIDILVDLTGHMGNNRLPAFARKPAPVQVTYPGYPDTTGLIEIDYCVTDADRDPPGMTEGYYTEALVRLPVTSQCYLPPGDAPPPSPPPSALTGRVTFGCFNKLVKVTAAMAGLWAKILEAAPGSRLMVLAASAGREESPARAWFAAQGVPAERLDLVPPLARREYLWRYNGIDVALDTFPYNGHTTTLDGLWMGVPAVTLAGETHASREGAAALSLSGLSDLIARTPEEYVAAAIRLAGERERLRALRADLRPRMAASALTDARRLTGELETAYRSMWRRWCEK